MGYLPSVNQCFSIKANIMRKTYTYIITCLPVLVSMYIFINMAPITECIFA